MNASAQNTVEAVIVALDVAPVGAMPMALLPVAGKSILAHRIDELRALGIARLTIITAFPRTVRAMADTLPLFELDWRIEMPSRIRHVRQRALILSADRLSEPDTAGPGIAPASLRDLIDLNLDVLRGGFAVPHVPGLRVAPGIYLETLDSATPANIRGCAHVGDGASLHPTARIVDTVLGAGVRIGAQVTLDRCIVAPGIRVPTGARLSGVFVLACGTVVRPPPAEIVRRAA